jgi:hypothetical protein
MNLGTLSPELATSIMKKKRRKMLATHDRGVCDMDEIHADFTDVIQGRRRQNAKGNEGERVFLSLCSDQKNKGQDGWSVVVVKGRR